MLFIRKYEFDVEAIKNNGLISTMNTREYKYGDDKMINEAINQLEIAFELGLAGLREYLNQLNPEDRERVILSISKSIQKENLTV